MKNKQVTLHTSIPRTYSQKRQSLGVSVCSQAFLSSLPNPATSLSFLCSMKRVAACCKTACCRKSSPFTGENERTRSINPSWQGQRRLQDPPSHLCNNCSRELGNPGMLFLGTLPGSQLAALLLLGVNERNTGFRCYPASFQSPAVWQKGRCFSKGSSNLFSAIQPAGKDSFCRASGSITVIGIPILALQQ